MNTKEHEVMKLRGSADVSYLGRTVDKMIWDFMEEEYFLSLFYFLRVKSVSVGL